MSQMDEIAGNSSLIDDLLDIIAELKTDVARASIPPGNCPYAYQYYPEWKTTYECDDCETCKREFFEQYRTQARQEAEKLKDRCR